MLTNASRHAAQLAGADLDRNSEAERRVTGVRLVAVSIGRTALPRAVPVSPAAHDAAVAEVRPRRARPRRDTVIIRRVPAGTPLPDIAAHVV